MPRTCSFACSPRPPSARTAACLTCSSSSSSLAAIAPACSFARAPSASTAARLTCQSSCSSSSAMAPACSFACSPRALSARNAARLTRQSSSSSLSGRNRLAACFVSTLRQLRHTQTTFATSRASSSERVKIRSSPDDGRPSLQSGPPVEACDARRTSRVRPR